MAQHRYQLIVEEIIAKLESGELKHGDQLPTEKEMCVTYGVSRITVQRAMKILSEKGIIHRISGKGTFAGASGAGVTSSKKKLIGLVMCSFSSAFGMDIIRAVEKKADQYGFSIILKNSYFDINKEKEIISLLVSLNVAGIIIQPVPNDFYNPDLVKLILAGFPIVTLDRDMRGLPVPYIGSDNYKIAVKATEFILNRGHKKICMFTGYLHDTSSLKERLAGFRQAIMNRGAVVTEDMLFHDIHSIQMGNLTLDDVYKDVERIEEYLSKHPDITCAFASEYAISRIIRMACEKLGKRVPEDISIMTFDNHNDIFRPNKTTYVRQRQEEMGFKAMDYMQSLISGVRISTNVKLDADIIDNGSVGNI